MLFHFEIITFSSTHGQFFGLVIVAKLHYNSFCLSVHQSVSPERYEENMINFSVANFGQLMFFSEDTYHKCKYNLYVVLSVCRLGFKRCKRHSFRFSWFFSLFSFLFLWELNLCSIDYLVCFPLYVFCASLLLDVVILVVQMECSSNKYFVNKRDFSMALN